ncbi:hypothetical protein Ddye_026823 [Dipteronia dyeriana]|uniref:Reverse transcriptase domain-containing protein n=1 Tax=Dipteronia dyeriana TaxID=168575 RepID=A0AAD9TNE6_9ROSI|nr:hypothetical protein Ddye_026823 [Dipteronia dyeriana]
MEHLRIKLGFTGKLVVNCSEKSCGLCLFWNVAFKVELLSFLVAHIDVRLFSSCKYWWRLIGFYGNPDTNQRTHFWTLLRRLAGMVSLPWICLGDFNEILDGVEKMGGIPKNCNLLSDSWETRDDCGLEDLGYIGPKVMRSKVDWLKCSDRNTKVLHMKSMARKACNKIKGLLGDNDQWYDSKSRIENIILNHFGILFQTCNPSQNEIGVVLDSVSHKLSSPISHFLDSIFTKDDILKAVLGLGVMKAPGKDGLPAVFYQKFYDKAGPSVTVAYLDCLNNGGSLEKMNETLTFLIPKKNVSNRILNFRPISLCNVLYKIMAKTIANRFRVALDRIISETRSAFILGRIWDKVKGWRDKFLSTSGKEILIKAVIEAIPTYSMNLFRLPEGVLHEIYHLCVKFWWGSNDTSRKIHWCTLARLCESKEKGGLGFRNLKIYNQSLLANQCWRIMTNDGEWEMVNQSVFTRIVGFRDQPLSIHFLNPFWVKIPLLISRFQPLMGGMLI